MNSHYDPLLAPFDDDAGNITEYYPDMTKEDFVRMLADRLPDYFSENIKITDISVKEVVKHNDQHKLGIEFTFADSNFSPVIYPDTLFEDYHAGKPLEEILQALSLTVEKSLPEVPGVTKETVTQALSDYESARHHLSIRLCDPDLNQELLENAIHSKISDFEAIYQLKFAMPDESVGYSTITPAMLDSWGVSMETLQKDAATCTWAEYPIFSPMGDTLSYLSFGHPLPNLLETGEPIQMSDDMLPVFVLSNDQAMQGASLITLPDLLDQIGDIIQDDFYILPSSLHEVLIVPQHFNSVDLDALSEMVQSVNESQVAAEDLLSDKVQHYDTKAHLLENAYAHQQRIEHEQAPLGQPETPLSYDIYQIRVDSAYHSLQFANLSELERMSQPVQKSNYEQVYTGTLSENSADGQSSHTEVLESLYEKFNLQHPADYRGHSLSVSDVVVLHENGRDTAYFCDSIGFKEVPEFLQEENLVTLETTGLVVDTHFGTWHTIDSQNFGGKDYFLMEHDKFGDEAACIIVDSSGKLVAEDIWNGFDKDTVEMILADQNQSDTPLISQQPKDLASDQNRDPSPEEKNYLKAAEEYSEENYNEVDGRMETESKQEPGDSIGDGGEAKSSVLKKLHEKQAAVSKQGKNVPVEKIHKSQDAELG